MPTYSPLAVNSPRLILPADVWRRSRVSFSATEALKGSSLHSTLQTPRNDDLHRVHVVSLAPRPSHAWNFRICSKSVVLVLIHCRPSPHSSRSVELRRRLSLRPGQSPALFFRRFRRSRRWRPSRTRSLSIRLCHRLALPVLPVPVPLHEDFA